MHAASAPCWTVARRRPASGGRRRFHIADRRQQSHRHRAVHPAQSRRRQPLNQGLQVARHAAKVRPALSAPPACAGSNTSSGRKQRCRGRAVAPREARRPTRARGPRRACASQGRARRQGPDERQRSLADSPADVESERLSSHSGQCFYAGNIHRAPAFALVPAPHSGSHADFSIWTSVRAKSS